jgi:hypothetical protein
LKQSYLALQGILTTGRTMESIQCLTVLGLWQGLFPLIIKAWRADNTRDKTKFARIAQHLERWAFLRALGGRRSDYKVGRLETLARDFNGDFDQLANNIVELTGAIADSDELEANLRYADFYNWEKNLARYVLWRYENSLRAKAGNQWSSLSWADVRAPVSAAVQYGLDHIAPQNCKQNDKLVKIPGDLKGRTKPFGEIWLHRLGNLVLDTRSAGASKGNRSMDSRLRNYQSSILFSQQDLIKYSIKNVRGKQTWGPRAIKKREDVIVAFCKNTWSI